MNHELIERRIGEGLRRLLEPIFRVLFNLNLGFPVLLEAAKMAAVNVASNDYGLRGRPTNISRVAAITGLTRKEVKRLRDVLNGKSEPAIKKSTVENMVAHWLNDKDFSERGKARVLKEDEGENSFLDLLRRYGKDVPPGAIRTEMIRVGAVKKDGNGNMTLVGNLGADTEQARKAIELLGEYGSGMARAIEMAVIGGKQHPVMMCGSSNIRLEDKERIVKICNEAMRGAEEKMQELFEAYDLIHDAKDSADQRVRVKVGGFVVQESQR